MGEIFELEINDIQPSQLFVSEQKLKNVYKWLNKDINSYDPIPVKDLNGKTVFTDGHTRSFALYKLGAKKVKVYWDKDELDWEAYQICVNWCLKEGITNITHLESRILNDDQYRLMWHERCRKMQAKVRKRKSQGSLNKPS
ncbi:hypothetical protein PRVXT_000357 [Proteinivorax tanatarense]|uniref:Uncharacterized protein n=1 Tax=Proteinivorax tanatarense TaxID=1260629 RepID=A0AAU7VMF1_9FIRM